MDNRLIKMFVGFISKPTVYYPIIMMVAFSTLRFLNLEFEAMFGFRILNPAIMGIILGYFFGRLIERERELNKLVISDPLSGLYNRVGLDSYIRQLFSKRADNTTISIVSIDIDDFKIINDTYGHDVGDAALSTIGKIIRENTRSSDIAARSGGDEFVIILPEANYKVAMRVAETIMNKISSTTIKADKGKTILLSVSIGVASSENSSLSDEDLFKLSDQQLYKSKDLGKNRICGVEV